ncbi:MAG: hypothetical protein DWP98_08460 [Bacteroidetes bacterium]|nr:MAG: hypothetical protein DWP98_08460 [Bacteroidota bacterium]MBL1145085.1 hypothetical protein [Bacteroidota bacterium]NOG57882.1 hypothetical protein [Bacteroidota bacterium]
MKKLFYLSFIALISLAACKSKKEAAEKAEPKFKEEAVQKVKADDSTILEEEATTETQSDLLAKKELAKLPDSLIARIQRTACFGRCPIYTASIYKSGYVEYLGQRWVKREGLFSSHMNQEQIDLLLNRAKEIGFMNLKNSYDSENITDLPSTIISLRIKDQAKIIVNRYQAPENLILFQQYFDELLDELEYKVITKD